MNRIHHIAARLGLASLLLGVALTASAQQQGGGGQGGGRGQRGGQGGPGNFDPAQMQQRMMERYREGLEFSESDWKAVEPLVTKVNEARREVGMGAMGRAMFGRPPGGGRGGDAQAQGGGQGGQGGRRGFGGEASPEMAALEKAIEAKAPASEIKAALGKVRDARKTKEAALAKAQDDLRQVLSVRQEAQAVMLGLLN